MDDQPAPKRKPGRPRVAEAKQSATVFTWVPPADRDKLITIAKAHDISVSKLVRVWIRQQLK